MSDAITQSELRQQLREMKLREQVRSLKAAGEAEAQQALRPATCTHRILESFDDGIHCVLCHATLSAGIERRQCERRCDHILPTPFAHCGICLLEAVDIGEAMRVPPHRTGLDRRRR